MRRSDFRERVRKPVPFRWPGTRWVSTRSVGAGGGLVAAILVGVLIGTASTHGPRVWARQNAPGTPKATSSGIQPPANNKANDKGKPKMSVGYDDTPFLPGDQWRVHDGKRPQPTVVTPAPAGPPVPAPSDARVLFDGTSLSGWKQLNGDECKWQLVDGGAMQVVKGTGDIVSKEEFGDCQLHLEFATPVEVKGDSQGRGNSGVFLMGRYEIQVLDCYDNPTYADGTVGAVYGQNPPLVNPSRKPGEWQTYDIVWQAPRFKDGKVERPAAVTVILNGVVVQAHYTLIGETAHRVVGTYREHPATGPLKLQDHGDLVRYRNIWYRPLNL